MEGKDPFAIAQMAISHHIYGNALSTGYGGIGYLLSLDGFALPSQRTGATLPSPPAPPYWKRRLRAIHEPRRDRDAHGL